MRILYIYPFKHQSSFANGICEVLSKNGIEVDSICWTSWELVFHSFSGKRSPFCYIFYHFLFQCLKSVPGIWRIGLASYLKKRCYISIIKEYSVIDLAGLYSENRLNMAQIAKSKGKKVILEFWGSDFNTITNYESDWHSKIIDISDAVLVSTQTMYNNIKTVYSCFSDKIVFVPIGLKQLETLKDIISNNNADFSFLDSRACDKIIITIGYSGRIWQQHFYAFDAIKRLPQEIKDKIFLLIPMTYDRENSYCNYLKDRLNKMNIPYQILDKRLSLIQNLSMRIASNISIIIQVNDAMAASVMEHLMAGSVLIAGDWLPYKELVSKGIYYRPTTKDLLYDTLLEVINNYPEEKEKCIFNKDIIYSLRSWTVLGKQMTGVYKQHLY